jgi:ankyrin repeat protein
MVAAQYGGSSHAIRLLLARGAQVRLPDGERALFNANPFFLAAYAGNADILPYLRDAGCDLDDKMALLGTPAITPINGAVLLGNLAVIKTVLDMGDAVDQEEPSGTTLLDRAVMSNQIGIAQLLITRGADVNHVDKRGMTPLLYAAFIDFGDSKMIDLLLKSGACPDTKTGQGRDALDLARKYKHTHLSASLEAARLKH